MDFEKLSFVLRFESRNSFINRQQGIDRISRDELFSKKNYSLARKRSSASLNRRQ